MKPNVFVLFFLLSVEYGMSSSDDEVGRDQCTTRISRSAIDVDRNDSDKVMGKELVLMLRNKIERLIIDCYLRLAIRLLTH